MVEHFSLVDNIAVKLITLACLVGYSLVLYYFRGCFYSLLRMVVSKLYDNIHFEEQNQFFNSFLNSTYIMGWVVLSLCTVRFVDMSQYGQMVAEATPRWVVVAIVPAMVVIQMVIRLYQHIIIGIAGRLTLSLGVATRLNHIRKGLFALFTMVATPVAILMMYSSENAAQIFAVILVVILAIAFILLIYKSCVLFIEQNISILDWFLYLCAVEIFPISLFVLIVLKNR